MSGAVVLVTGANRGIGRAVAEACLGRGDHVIATARRRASLADLPGGTAQLTALELDVADDASIDAARRAAEEVAPALDLLVNSAGLYSLRSKAWDAAATTLEHLTSEELMTVFRVNAVGPMLLLRALRPLLRRSRRARVLNLTSLLGSVSARTSGGDYAYAASKAALNIMTRAAAAELAGDGITCIALTPGWVRTEMGGAAASLSPAESAARLLRTADALRPADSGRLLDEDGRDLPW